MPTVLKTLIIFSFSRGAQPSAIWWRDYFKSFIIVVILNLNVLRRVAYFSQVASNRSYQSLSDPTYKLK